MKVEKTSFSLLLGPGLLIVAILLLLYKSSSFVGHIWLAGLGLTILIASVITYLAYQEFRVFEKKHLDHQTQKEKEMDDLRSVLDETHLLHREKVEKLENTITAVQKEQKDLLAEKEESLQELKRGYEELFEQSIHHKNQVTSLQASLEEALGEVRDLRQREYLKQETEKEIPKDLLQQHKQLRMQFEEKSLILEKIRKEFFDLEGEFVFWKKEIDCSEIQEKLIEHMKEISVEKCFLEEEILLLEQMIKELVKPARAKKSKPKPKIEKMLELQFEKPSS